MKEIKELSEVEFRKYKEAVKDLTLDMERVSQKFVEFIKNRDNFIERGFGLNEGQISELAEYEERLEICMDVFDL